MHHDSSPSSSEQRCGRRCSSAPSRPLSSSSTPPRGCRLRAVRGIQVTQPPHRRRALFNGVVLLQTALLLATMIMVPAPVIAQDPPAPESQQEGQPSAEALPEPSTEPGSEPSVELETCVEPMPEASPPVEPTSSLEPAPCDAPVTEPSPSSEPPPTLEPAPSAEPAPSPEPAPSAEPGRRLSPRPSAEPGAVGRAITAGRAVTACGGRRLRRAVDRAVAVGRAIAVRRARVPR